MITADEREILELINKLKHPTTDQLHHYAFSHMTKRNLNLKLEHLRRTGLIDAHLLYPEQGQRSPRYFHLLQAGARELGLERVKSNHYRIERREFFHVRSAIIELEHMASRHNWRVITDDKQAHVAVRDFLLKHAKAEHGEDIPAHVIAPIVPRFFKPDRVLVTDREPLLVLIAHPHSGQSFWRNRMKKYKHIIHTARAIGIALTSMQSEECARLLEELELTRRVLILTPHTLDQIEMRLS